MRPLWARKLRRYTERSILLRKEDKGSQQGGGHGRRLAVSRISPRASEVPWIWGAHSDRRQAGQKETMCRSGEFSRGLSQGRQKPQRVARPLAVPTCDFPHRVLSQKASLQGATLAVCTRHVFTHTHVCGGERQKQVE